MAETSSSKFLTSSPFVSVIIPCYNCSSTVQWTIDALKQQTYLNKEIILVDDGSKDSTLDLLKKSGFTVLTHEKNKGPGAARNTGIKASNGRILLFLDSDATIDNDWIQRHVSAHLEGNKVVGGSTKPLKNNFWGMADHYSTWYDFSPRASRDSNRTQLNSANLSIDRDVFEKVGNFREDLANNEDVELTGRIKAAGFSLNFIPSISIYHHDRETFSGFWKHHYKYGFSTLKVRTKNSNTRYNWIIPRTKISALISILPLSILFTGYVCLYWARHEPKALIYSPLIFLSKIAHLWGIYRSFENG